MSKLKTYKFSQLYSMSSGISSKPEQAGHGKPFLSFSAVFNNYFLPDSLNDLMDTSEIEQETYSILKGDIFLTRTSEVIDELGMSSVALKDYPKATYSGFLKRLRPTQTDVTYYKYMAFYLRSNLFRKTMTNNAVLTLRASLNENIFSYLDLILPEYNQQVKSGDLLYLINSKIELNNRINAELESLAKTIYDYWFVQFDFPNTDGKPYKSSGGEMVYVEEGKGDRAIPAGWEIGRVSDLFEINPSETLSKGTLSAYIDMSAIPTSGFMTGEIQYKPFNGGMKFRNGDVVIARITPCLENGKTGLITLLKDNEIGFGSTEFIVLRGKNRSLSSFAACLSRSVSFRNFAISNMTGTSGRKRVDAKAIERFSIPIPEDGLISQFEDVVSRYFQLLTINTRENQQLTQLRDWLLPMLMNGQVSIK